MSCLLTGAYSPVQFYWQYPPTTEGHCLDEGIATLTSGILNIVADVITTAVPVPLVMRLHMPLRQRMGVSVLFGLGFIVIVAGSVRTYYIWKGRRPCPLLPRPTVCMF